MVKKLSQVDKASKWQSQHLILEPLLTYDIVHLREQSVHLPRTPDNEHTPSKTVKEEMETLKSKVMKCKGKA